MAIREVVVETLGELLDRCTPSHPDPVTGRRRDTGVYRGAFDAARPLLTSLDRLGGVAPAHSKGALESHVLRNFIRYSRPHFPIAQPSDWELLVTAQHHGVPTRLLDWTYSPLVAAHFATRDGRGGDETAAAVWRLDWQRLHEAFGFPPLSLLTQDLERLLGGPEERCTPWQLFEGRSARGPFACLVEPPSLDARIVVQAATFTLCSDRDRPFDRFLADHGLEDALTKFVIPPHEASRVRDQLDLVGFDERRLFPDLDGIAASLRRYYA
jgi:hypothetical protein